MNIQAASFRESPRKAASVVTRQDELTWFDSIDGERSAIHVRADQSGGAFGMVESVVAPGAASPRHYHREAELFFIIAGLATIEVGGVIHRAPPGTTVLVPPGVPHAWKNPTMTPLRLLATFTPGGVEAMFERFAGKKLDQIVKLAETYGTYVVDPAYVK